MIQAKIRKRFAAGPESVGFSLDLEFQASRGFTVLFGPSGAGKTLTLDCVAGFVQPDEGPHSAGRPDSLRRCRASLFRAARASCGYVFQNYALFPHMTLREESGICGRAHPASGASPKDRMRCWRSSISTEVSGPASVRVIRRAEAALLHRARFDRRAPHLVARRADSRVWMHHCGPSCTPCCGRFVMSSVFRYCWSRTISKSACV